MLAVGQHLRAIDEHVTHSDRVLVRLLERGPIGDRSWIEDGNVGEHAFAKEAAPIEFEVGCR